MAKNDDFLKMADFMASLNHDSEIDKKLHELDKKAAIDEAVKANNWVWIKKTIGICISTTSALIGFFVWLGMAIYDKYEPIKIGVRATILAIRGNHE